MLHHGIMSFLETTGFNLRCSQYVHILYMKSLQTVEFNGITVSCHDGVEHIHEIM